MKYTNNEKKHTFNKVCYNPLKCIYIDEHTKSHTLSTETQNHHDQVEQLLNSSQSTSILYRDVIKIITNYYNLGPLQCYYCGYQNMLLIIGTYIKAKISIFQTIFESFYNDSLININTDYGIHTNIGTEYSAYYSTLQCSCDVIKKSFMNYGQVDKDDDLGNKLYNITLNKHKKATYTTTQYTLIGDSKHILNHNKNNNDYVRRDKIPPEILNLVDKFRDDYYFITVYNSGCEAKTSCHGYIVRMNKEEYQNVLNELNEINNIISII